MSTFNWKNLLKADPTDWLLEEDNPSVRFFTLVDYQNKPLKNREVVKARRGIMKIGVVPKILDKQKEGGYWEKAEDFYIRTKFKGTVWQMIILAELGADGEDNRIQKICEYLLKQTKNLLLWII